MAKLVTLFENYDDAELVDFCLSTLNSSVIWSRCISIDISTGDMSDDDCDQRLQQLIDWACEFYEVDIDTLQNGGLRETEPDSYTSAYTLEDDILILIESHPL